MAAFIVHEVERAFRMERVFRDRVHPLEAYSEEELVKKYRFSREGILHIMGLVGEEAVNHATARNHALPALLQVMIALNYFATGAVFDSIATVHGVHRSSISRSVHTIAAVLCRQKNNVSSLHYHELNEISPLKA